MLVIGNGESRLQVDLDKIDICKIGCNAIRRDYEVDHLVCVDRRMVQEALESKFTNTIYTREDWIGQFSAHKNVELVPTVPYQPEERKDEPFQWGSGPYAVLLAATLSKKVKLIGFDLFSATGTVNNVYKSTTHYDNSDKHAVDPSYWIHQISKVFEYFPLNKFTVYQNRQWILPDSWKYPNVFLDNLDVL